mgnify:CR=1 FL=1
MEKNFNNVVLQCFTFQLGQYICLISTKLPSMQEPMHKTGFAGVLQHNLNGICRSLLVVVGKHAC